MAIYKISFVILDSDHPGAIVNRYRKPKVGEKVRLGTENFEVIEVYELMPPKGNFNYIHVTCRSLDKDDKINRYRR